MLFFLALSTAAAISNAGYITNTAYNTDNNNNGSLVQLKYNKSKAGKIYNISKNDAAEENAEEKENDEVTDKGNGTTMLDDEISDDDISSCVSAMQNEDADSGLVRLAYSIARDRGVATSITINR
jgi:hypothetical protein